MEKHLPAQKKFAGIYFSSRPKPSVPTAYNVNEAVFWTHRHLPAGVSYRSSGAFTCKGRIAALVLETESQSTGIWVKVKVVGASTEEAKKEAT